METTILEKPPGHAAPVHMAQETGDQSAAHRLDDASCISKITALLIERCVERALLDPETSCVHWEDEIPPAIPAALGIPREDCNADTMTRKLQGKGMTPQQRDTIIAMITQACEGPLVDDADALMPTVQCLVNRLQTTGHDFPELLHDVIGLNGDTSAPAIVDKLLQFDVPKRRRIITFMREMIMRMHGMFHHSKH